MGQKTGLQVFNSTWKDVHGGATTRLPSELTYSRSIASAHASGADGAPEPARQKTGHSHDVVQRRVRQR